MSQHATDTRLGQIDDHPLISSPNNWSKIARPTLDILRVNNKE